MTCGARAGPASSISRRKRLAMPRYTASRLRYRWLRSDATGGPGVCPARGPLSFSIRGSFQYADRQRQRAKYSAHRAERTSRCKPHARLNVGYPEVQLKHQRAVPGREPPDALTGHSALMSVVEVRMAALRRGSSSGSAQFAARPRTIRDGAERRGKPRSAPLIRRMKPLFLNVRGLRSNANPSAVTPNVHVGVPVLPVAQ